MGDGYSNAVIGLVGVVVGAAIAGAFAYLATNREMNVQMVQIAIGILSAKPEANIRPAREWAVDVINSYSDVPLSPDAKAALLENPLATVDWGKWGMQKIGGLKLGPGVIAPPEVPEAR